MNVWIFSSSEQSWRALKFNLKQTIIIKITKTKNNIHQYLILSCTNDYLKIDIFR